MPLQHVSSEVTVDPINHEKLVVFDLGGATVAYVISTIIASNPDGEPYGYGAGQISMMMSTPETSPDGVSWYEISGIDAGDQVGGESYLGIPTVPAPTQSYLMTSLRYLRVHVMVVGQYNNLYTGTHHPSATWNIDVEYRK